jgi:uncharacterized membrane protein (DUF373 family)
MLKFVEKFEKGTIFVLIGLMMLAILFGTFELAVLLIKELLNEPRFLLDIKKLLDIFGFFFMILIGLELLETIKTYITKEQLHVEIVFLVAMIAIARKVIILDLKRLPPSSLVGIAAIILALSGGYWMIKLALKENVKNPTGRGSDKQT